MENMRTIKLHTKFLCKELNMRALSTLTHRNSHLKASFYPVIVTINRIFLLWTHSKEWSTNVWHSNTNLLCNQPQIYIELPKQKRFCKWNFYFLGLSLYCLLVIQPCSKLTKQSTQFDSRSVGTNSTQERKIHDTSTLGV